MAETGNPLFVMASSPACSAAGAISVLVSFLQLIFVTIEYTDNETHYNSDYKWSVRLILAIQSIGVGVGSIAPIFRLFAALNFKLSIKWSKNEMKLFHVENYWLKLLEDWKRSGKPLKMIRGRRWKKLAHFAKNLILNICIGFQILVVIMCKMIRFIPISVIIFFFYFFYCVGLVKNKLLHSLCAPSTSNVPSGSQPIGQDTTETDYVVLLQKEVEISKRTLKSISNAVDRLVKKAKKNNPDHLIDLLRKHSAGLDGVYDIAPQRSEEAPNCWSLAVVTLTSIAIALLKDKSGADSLLRSISEGLIYVNHVEKNLNIGTNHSEALQKTKKNLSEAIKTANQVWLEVELEKKWLRKSLQGMDQQGRTPRQILLWLSKTATDIMLTKFKDSENGSRVEGFDYEFIAANSMYRISQTILSDDRFQSHETAVEGLKVMISDILCACLTNIPRVIMIKCHTGAIEKREKSVRAAAMLLGETEEMLKILEDVHSPALDPNQMAYLNNWSHTSLNRQNPVDPIGQSGSEATTFNYSSRVEQHIEVITK